MNKSEIVERAQQYTKKPVTIWAFQYNGNNAGDVLFWIGGSDAAIAAAPNRLAFVNEAGDFLIRTLESGEGYHIVSIGDFVIQGVAGEFYPCKPDIFAKTYELVERAIAESRECSRAPYASLSEGGEPTTAPQICIDCGHEFGVWFAENPVWNEIIPGRVGMLCPCCFIARADKQGFRTTGWKMVPMDNPLGEKSVELGDGEPSPPPDDCQKCGKPKLGPMSTVASGYLRETEGMWCGCVEIWESGASQEVSPPSLAESIIRSQPHIPDPGGLQCRNCSKAEGDTWELKAASVDFVVAVERLLNWMNGNDLSADHETARPDDFRMLCESLTKVKQILCRASVR